MKCAVLLQSYFLDAKTALLLNWPSWFLSSLMFCYFMAPIINRLVENRTKKFYVLFFILLFATAFIWSYVWKDEAEAYGRGYYYVYIFPLARVIDFTLGSIMSFYFSKYRNSERQESIISHIFEAGSILLLFLSIVIVDAILKSARYADVYRIYVYTAVYLPSSFLLVWIFADEKGFITKTLSNSTVLQSLGAMSFELYITHRMIILFFAHFNTTILYWLLSVITTLIVSKTFVVIKNFMVSKNAVLPARDS